MRYELKSIMAEIETLQHNASKTGRRVETVYLTDGELDEFSLECKAYGMGEDPLKVPAHDVFFWKGTKIKRDLKR